MNAIAQIVGRSEAILFDFDGPVCHLFAGHPASGIAEELRSFLIAQGIKLPDQIRDSSDPFMVYRWAAMRMPHVASEAEALLTEAEQQAVSVAIATRHGHEAIDAAADGGWKVAIVSNNSPETVETYLAKHHIDGRVSVVIGRSPGRPELLKPSPSPVVRAAESLSVQPRHCVLIGDTVADIQAACAAGTHSIGYAKRQTRVSELLTAGADAVTEDMGLVSRALQDHARV